MRIVYKGTLLVFSALARAMNRVGYKVHVSHVSRVMRGERDASKDFIEALCKVMGFTVAEARKFIEDVSEAIQYVEGLPPTLPEDTL